MSKRSLVWFQEGALIPLGLLQVRTSSAQSLPMHTKELLTEKLPSICMVCSVCLKKVEDKWKSVSSKKHWQQETQLNRKTHNGKQSWIGPCRAQTSTRAVWDRRDREQNKNIQRRALNMFWEAWRTSPEEYLPLAQTFALYRVSIYTKLPLIVC